MNWISVTEKIPDSDGDYLASTPVLKTGGKYYYNINIVYYSNGKWFSYVDHKPIFVTHFMELPEPPKN